jgi:hypothetical protein
MGGLQLSFQTAKSNKAAMKELAQQVGQWASDLVAGIQDQQARGGELHLRQIQEDVAEAQKCVTFVVQGRAPT